MKREKYDAATKLITQINEVQKSIKQTKNLLSVTDSTFYLAADIYQVVVPRYLVLQFLPDIQKFYAKEQKLLEKELDCL
jgi:hypothetical protein